MWRKGLEPVWKMMDSGKSFCQFVVEVRQNEDKASVGWSLGHVPNLTHSGACHSQLMPCLPLRVMHVFVVYVQFGLPAKMKASLITTLVPPCHHSWKTSIRTVEPSFSFKSSCRVWSFFSSMSHFEQSLLDMDFVTLCTDSIVTTLSHFPQTIDLTLM